MRHRSIIIILIFFASILITGCNQDTEILDNTIINNSQTTTPYSDTTIENTTPEVVLNNSNQTNKSLSNNSTNNNVIIIEPITNPNTDTNPDKDKSIEASDTLRELLEDKITEYTIEYSVSSDESSYEIVQVFDLPKFVIIMPTGEEETRTIFDGSNMFICKSMDSSWQCFKTAIQKSQSASLEEDIMEDTTKVTNIGICDVARESGTKYEIISKDSKTIACYTDDGILLEIYTEIPELYMIATKVTRTFDESLFIIPAEPQEI